MSSQNPANCRRLAGDGVTGVRNALSGRERAVAGWFSSPEVIAGRHACCGDPSVEVRLNPGVFTGSPVGFSCGGPVPQPGFRQSNRGDDPADEPRSGKKQKRVIDAEDPRVIGIELSVYAEHDQRDTHQDSPKSTADGAALTPDFFL